jgi:hypothetical protein
VFALFKNRQKDRKIPVKICISTAETDHEKNLIRKNQSLPIVQHSERKRKFDLEDDFFSETSTSSSCRNYFRKIFPPEIHFANSCFFSIRAAGHFM